MDTGYLANVATVAVIVLGVGALYFAMRQSGDKLTEDKDAVDKAIKDIDRARLSNVLSQD